MNMEEKEFLRNDSVCVRCIVTGKQIGRAHV